MWGDRVFAVALTVNASEESGGRCMSSAVETRSLNSSRLNERVRASWELMSMSVRWTRVVVGGCCIVGEGGSAKERMHGANLRI